MHEQRIHRLEIQHQDIDNQIDRLERSGVFDDKQMQQLKKHRLAIRDKLSRLRREKWEHDHETVDLGDDR